MAKYGENRFLSEISKSGRHRDLILVANDALGVYLRLAELSLRSNEKFFKYRFLKINDVAKILNLGISP